jgi:hypothetical protein
MFTTLFFAKPFLRQVDLRFNRPSRNDVLRRSIQ